MAQPENPNIAVVRRYFEEVYNQGRTDVLPELVTDDYRDYGHATPGEGVKGAEDDFKAISGGFDQLHFAIDSIIAAGDNVGAAWTGTMRQKADVFGIANTGKTVSYKGVSIYTLRDGKITATRNVQDFGSVLAQLQAAQ